MRFVVFHKGITETLAYFSSCIAKELEALGHTVLRFEIKDETQQLPELLRFLQQGDVTLLTFNFHGIQQEAIFYEQGKEFVQSQKINSKNKVFCETSAGRLLWDVYEVRCINIVVDHPLYYWKFYDTLPKNYIQLCIDGGHEAYMRKMYPKVRLLPTMPLAGSSIGEAVVLGAWKKTLEKSTGTINAGLGERQNKQRNEEIQKLPKRLGNRKYDVVFAGNYKPPREFEPLITRNGPEYEQFYREILKEFFSHPEKDLNTVFEAHIRQNMGELTKQELAQAFHYLMFLDMYVRFHYRGEVVRLLTEAEIPVHVYGLGWERLHTARPDLLICHGSVDTADCLDAFGAAKISLNVMPWFKQGAHDRIYSSMLSGAVTLTDTSRYLVQRFSDRKQLVFYKLGELSKVPELVKELLVDTEGMQQIADCGYVYAKEHLTWQCFVAELLEQLS